MSVLSKFEYKSKYPPYKEGGNDAGDYHAWVEDMTGKVVFDPVLETYEFICNIRGLNINKVRRKKWDNQDKHMKQRDFDKIFHLAMIGNYLDDFYICPKPGHCRTNSIAWLSNQPESKRNKYRVVIGSMGWEDSSGDVFWEYG